MIPVSYYVPSEVTSPKFAYAFARGCGGEVTDDLDYLHPNPIACFGSPPVWPLVRQAQAEGRTWYFGDHGYFGRKHYYRITRNAYQHDGRGVSTGERFRVFGHAVHPWTRRGSHVLICPNSAVYFALHGLDVTTWLRETIATLQHFTDRPIRVRWKTQTYTRPIARDLHNAWAVVVFSSACALDALIAGVPVFTLAPFAASVRMGLSDLARIERPIYPDDRERFFGVLADQQWTLPEIFRGEAWRALQTEVAHAA